MSDETTMLPCPLCGSKAHMCKMESGYSTEYAICCNYKGCRLSEHPRFGRAYKNEAEAIAAWNTRATHGTLTAEHVREAIEANSWVETSTLREFNDSSWQAIADELNAELGSGTCKITATATNNLMYPDYMTKWYELSCGHSLTLKGYEAPKWCAVCGKAVER